MFGHKVIGPDVGLALLKGSWRRRWCWSWNRQCESITCQTHISGTWSCGAFRNGWSWSSHLSSSTVQLKSSCVEDPWFPSQLRGCVALSRSRVARRDWLERPWVSFYTISIKKRLRLLLLLLLSSATTADRDSEASAPLCKHPNEPTRVQIKASKTVRRGCRLLL